ncbi:fibronectin type III domain-containing protein, partial [Bacillus sp. JCM 19034]|uniref:fibronectin type III domain-containing protein n=1 Tax=Bacillus sp. JCM 19034 TaxID=1481928 RepID=UPI000ABDA59F
MNKQKLWIYIVVLAMLMNMFGPIGVTFSASEDVENNELDEPYIIIEDFEDGADLWSVSGARYNSINLSIVSKEEGPVRFGNQSLKVDYDFLGQQGTSGVYAGKEIAIPGHPEKIGMWVYGDGHSHWLRGQLRDANNQAFNIDFTGDYPNGVTWEGWKYVEASVPTTWEAPFKLELPVRYMATNDQGKSKGTIYIDQIRAVYGPTDEDLINPSLDYFEPKNEEIAYKNQPEISVIATDNDGGSGIDSDRIYMKIDGNDVIPNYDPETGKVSYIPEHPLAEGYHTAWVEVFDNAGNHTFSTWTFHVSTGGPEFNFVGDEEVYAGGSFDLILTMSQISQITGASSTITYDDQLLEFVNVSFPEKILDSVLISNTEINGQIELEWENLETLDLDENEVVAILTFQLGLDATGEVAINFEEGSITYLDEEIGTLPFYMTPFQAPILQPLVLTIEGTSVDTPSKLTVTNRNGEPIEGANISITNGQKFLRTTNDTYIYQGGSGVAGDKLQEVAAGSYFAYANDPSSTFDYYRIFMPNGQQRYFHIPAEDAEVINWGETVGQTDENGEIHTDLVTLSQITLALQASKDELVSQVLTVNVVPQLADHTPKNILLTWSDDPKTTQHISWQTGTAIKDSIVEVRTQDGDKVDVFEGTNKLFADPIGEMRIHRVTVDHLQPGTTYQYRVGDGTEEGWSEFSSFTTEALESEPFSFLFATDTQATNEAGFALWTKLYEAGITHNPNTKFVLHAGDIVENGNFLREWDYFLAASQGISTKMPIMPVLGNHDVYGDGELTFKSLFTLAQNGPNGKEGYVYSFEYGDALFIMLNSEFGVQDMREQQDWIREQVEGTEKEWVISMFHRSPYSSNPLTGRDATAETFSPILEELGVDLVLTGHDHAYMRSHLIKNGQVQKDGPGTQYIIGGSAGPKFYPGEQYDYVNVLFEDNIQVITSFTVDGNEIRGEAITIDGEVIDSFTLTKQVEEEPVDPELPGELPLEPTDPQLPG